MSGAATIVFAREDFSIPGTPDAGDLKKQGLAAVETRFFDLLRDSKPDVVVLDLSRAGGNGIETILKIRRESTIPILVVCDANHPSAQDYRIAGAADCIPAPVDLLLLNQSLQQIIRVTRQTKARPPRIAEAMVFAGMTLYPHQDLLIGPDGSSTKLTTSENRLLSHFLANSWVLCTRTEIGEMLYGGHRPVSDRAIDVVVNRLRKKMVSLCGLSAQYLIKTEFRRGYMLIADVSTPPVSDPPRADIGRRVVNA